MMTHRAFTDQVRSHLGITLSEAQGNQFQAYVKRLYAWSDRVRLISRHDRDHIWARHIIDCLSLVPHLPASGWVLDLGSGAGLPGVPIKIARPDLEVVLLEPQRMKSLFLAEVIQALNLEGLHHVRDRAEIIATDMNHRGHYERVTARAVGGLSALWILAQPLLAPQGCLLAMKGPGEVDGLDTHPEVVVKETLIRLPLIDRDRAIVAVSRRPVSRETQSDCRWG